ncbi:MAG: D-alanyl-D-alanine carboxypeptidase, partial [Clostridia bacterium]|nr:D-alanyl-D-alanine carboxypeptidase [Clostridia bacterium]
PDERHYTTARDLAFISAYAMENPKFREIVSCKYYEPRNWKNKNKMLFEYEGANGVKTGYTVRAGRCLVTGAERNGMQLVCVVLDSPQMYERTAELLDNAFAAYSMKELCSAQTGVEGYAIDYSFSYPLTENELGRICINTEILDPVPTQAGEFAGQMQIYLENNLLFSQNLYIMKK